MVHGMDGRWIENEEHEWMRRDKDLPHSSLRLLLLSHIRVNVHFSLFHCFTGIHTQSLTRSGLESHLICLPCSLFMVNSTAIFSTRVTSKKWKSLTSVSLNWKRKEKVKWKKRKKSRFMPLADCINLTVIKSARGFSLFRSKSKIVKLNAVLSSLVTIVLIITTTAEGVFVLVRMSEHKKRFISGFFN